ncbi:MAG TPA: sugar phosphorylase [Vicinamibacteria bacterium]|nr:sugar phosphorylase [Vicinamibacteria bacterium]
MKLARPLVPPRLTRLHLPAADYTRPLLEVRPEDRRRILSLLQVLYGRARAEACYAEVERLMKVHFAHKTPEMIEDDRGFDPRDRFSEQDVILITYGDLILSPGKRPLRALMHFLDTFMRGAVNTIHVLPFFPYSSDRGFAVTDFEEVDPRLGSWEDIEELSQRYRMMFDGVFNHVSARSRWFQRFLSGRPGYEDFFIAFGTTNAVSPDHLKLILRPRTSELLTPFHTMNGPRFVWTTFSPDQVDLNFKNERVLQRVLEVLLLYVRKGADVVRLDAVTYIWHELGTRCAHLTETHALVQLFRAVLDVVAPQTALVTETNVPHADNVGYFGDGRNEAQMIYNFALPPLVLHTFHIGSVAALSRWARGLRPPSSTATFFNFLDSHDGIGLLGAEGILSPDEIAALVARCGRHGGLVSQRSKDGSDVPYELNITWWSAMNRDDAGEPQALQVARFLASRAIALVLQGVPGVYLPSAFGAKNDTAAVLEGAEKRSINRKTLDETSLLALLQDRASWVYAVASGLRRLAKRRIATKAFHPNSPQSVLDAGDAVFAVLRGEGAGRVVALTNVTARDQVLSLDVGSLGGGVAAWSDLLSRRRFAVKDGRLETTLRPYAVVWLAPAG